MFNNFISLFKEEAFGFIGVLYYLTVLKFIDFCLHF